MVNFPGFARPRSNFYRLPNDWFDLWRQARVELAQGAQPARILAPLKIVEYVIKYTWGRTNFDEPIRLSRSDLRKGVRGKHNRRLDLGTGLGSEASISHGITTALALGLLEQVEHNQDPARQERLYLPRLEPPPTGADDGVITRPALGFTRPEANFFLVPAYWTDITADIRSEILIIAVEYFFRHAWGWQAGEREIRWLDADDLAGGRKYRSAGRRGDRYDGGTGYTARKLRDALDEGVSRGLLVWRQAAAGREFALRMAWMEAVRADGYFDPADQSVEGEDQNVGGWDQSVGGKDQSVEGWDQVVEVGDQNVGGADQNVGDTDQLVEVADQPVGRTYRDTLKTPPPDTDQTPTTRPPKSGVGVSPGVLQQEDALARLLAQAGLSGFGLAQLCRKSPPLDLCTVKAVLLYAEAHNLGPGYIYRTLESGAPVDGLFLDFAGLDEASLALFRQAVAELRERGSLITAIHTPIPAGLVDLFTRFAAAFAGADPAAVGAALSRPAGPPLEPGDGPPLPGPLESLWQQAQAALQSQMTRQTFDTWLKETRLVARDGPRFVIAAKNSFAVDWLQHRLLPTIQRTLAGLVQAEAPEVEVVFVVEAE